MYLFDQFGFLSIILNPLELQSLKTVFEVADCFCPIKMNLQPQSEKVMYFIAIKTINLYF